MEAKIFNYVFQAIKFTVLWIFVPAIIIVLILMEKKIAEGLEDPKDQISARAGWWGGLILSVFYIISQFQFYSAPSTLFNISVKISVLGGLIGIAVGFVHFWARKMLVSNRAIGILTLLFTLVCSTFLISYFFVRTNNDFIFSAVLGLVFGEFLHLVIFPENFEEIYFIKSRHMEKVESTKKEEEKGEQAKNEEIK